MMDQTNTLNTYRVTHFAPPDKIVRELKANSYKDAVVRFKKLTGRFAHQVEQVDPEPERI